MKLKCASGELVNAVKAPNGIIVVTLPNKYQHFQYWDQAKKFIKALNLAKK